MRKYAVALTTMTVALAGIAGPAWADGQHTGDGNGAQGCPGGGSLLYRNAGTYFQVVRDTTGDNPAEFAESAHFDNVGEAVDVLCKQA